MPNSPVELSAQEWLQAFHTAAIAVGRTTDEDYGSWIDRVQHVAERLVGRAVAMAGQPVVVEREWEGVVAEVHDPARNQEGVEISGLGKIVIRTDRVHEGRIIMDYGWVNRREVAGQQLLQRAAQLIGKQVRYTKCSRQAGNATRPYILSVSPIAAVAKTESATRSHS